MSQSDDVPEKIRELMMHYPENIELRKTFRYKVGPTFIEFHVIELSKLNLLIASGVLEFMGFLQALLLPSELPFLMILASTMLAANIAYIAVTFKFHVWVIDFALRVVFSPSRKIEVPWDEIDKLQLTTRGNFHGVSILAKNGDGFLLWRAYSLAQRAMRDIGQFIAELLSNCVGSEVLYDKNSDEGPNASYTLFLNERFRTVQNRPIIS